MDLVPYIYWEKQEEGSQLCAQHCLNTILQQFAYTEFDLAEIAQNLDQAENAALGPSQQNKKSYNLDDTGFFSVSVLERALQVWDLTLVRWRGEAMKPFQEHPEEQAAFILNLASHWLPLRRFSPHHPSSSPNSSFNRWYNLNSFLPNGPEWISPTYLRLVLTQAEKEGYSVFVVRKAGGGSGMGDNGVVGGDGEGIGWGDGGIGVLPESQGDRIAVELGEPAGRGGSANVVGASGSYPNKANIPSVDPGPSAGPSTHPQTNLPTSPAAGSGRRRRRQGDLTPVESGSNQVDIFDDSSFANPAHASDSDLPTSDPTHDDDEEILDDEDEDESPALGRPIAARQPADQFGYEGPLDFALQSRSYDDEDADLQAALTASMADVPADWTPPALEPKNKVVKKAAEKIKEEVKPEVKKDSPAPEGARSGSKFREEVEDDEDEIPAEVLSPEEIRKRRLAKFQ